MSDGISDGNWYTPDAFSFGDTELSSIWIGKFETSSSNPNIENGGGNRYGFTSNVDTHMMKSSEWAVVSYLSQSKYGKLGNTDFSGVNKEIYQNKSDSYITGCSYGSPSNSNKDYGCQYKYDESTGGTGASTTGNIYGIYDMSGGSWEYVMGNYNDTIGSSEFQIMLESKYYDKYTSDNIRQACNGSECMSHALLETVGWYNDYQTMITATYPWLLRGGYYYNGTGAGVFYFSVSTAGGSINDSFRLVLTSNS